MSVRTLREFGGMLAGAAALAGAVNLFFKPMAIFAGGVPGIAIIIQNALGSGYYDCLGWIILGVSALFFIIQAVYSPKRRVLKGVVTSATFIALVQVSTPLTRDIAISDNLLLMAIGGSIAAGFGISMILISGYSFIGTVGLSEIISKRLEINPGRSVFYIESAVIVAGSLVIGAEQAMISALGLYVMTRTIHAMTFGLFQYKKILIVSPRLEAIRDDLTTEVCEEASVLLARNAARDEEQNLLMIIIRYDQFKRTRDIIRGHDPHAVVIASDVTEMLGEGFRTL